MTAEEFIKRLHLAGCRTFIHQGTVNVLTSNEKIVRDLEERGARKGVSYVRNPGGVRDLGEEPVTEWDISLRAGLNGVTGPGVEGEEPVTLDHLIAAHRKVVG